MPVTGPEGASSEPPPFPLVSGIFINLMFSSLLFFVFQLQLCAYVCNNSLSWIVDTSLGIQGVDFFFFCLQACRADWSPDVVTGGRR